MDQPKRGIRYRPEIDGLRAVAVLAVVASHAGLGTPGGYVGVDVFFVISGFLITSIIERDVDSGTFTLAGFWESRARRIVPALVAVVASTLVAGWFTLFPADYADLGSAAASQALFGANIHYWRETGYFAPDASQKALLHTWSLAVEEQFYLIVPLITLTATLRHPIQLRQRGIFLVVVGIFASLTLAIATVERHSAACFYLLPTRAWELALGVLLALSHANAPRNMLVRESLAFAGIGAIALPSLLYTGSTPFPGITALPPCLGAAAIILANCGSHDLQHATIVGTALSTRPMVFLGRISYSLYLCHWPIFSLAEYSSTSPLSARTMTLLVVTAFIVAVASWRFIEQPFRRHRLLASRRSLLAATSSSLILIFASGVVIAKSNGFRERFSADVLAFADVKSERAFIHELTVAEVARGDLVRIGVRTPNARPQILVWGDSFAMAAMPAFDALLTERNATGVAATHSGTAPVLGYFEGPRSGMGRDALKFNEEVISYVEAHRISDVVLIAAWHKYDDEPNTSGSLSLHAGIAETVRRLRSAGSRPWVLLEVPTHTFDVPRVLAHLQRRGGDIESLCTPRSDKEPRALADLAADGAIVIDPRPRFESKLVPACYGVTFNGKSLYRDAGHLTEAGATSVLLPLLRETFAYGGE